MFSQTLKKNNWYSTSITLANIITKLGCNTVLYITVYMVQVSIQ